MIKNIGPDGDSAYFSATPSMIKKPTLPRNDLKNYRPVSGLNYISKVIERVVAYQVKEYLSHNNLNNIYQSRLQTWTLYWNNLVKNQKWYSPKFSTG